MRLRIVSIGLAVSACGLLLTTAQAGALAAGHQGVRLGHRRPAASSTAQLARTGILSLKTPGPARETQRPAARLIDYVFTSDSCTTQPDNPSITSTCQAVGYFADAPYIDGLQESSSNSQWGTNIFGSLANVTEPLDVSCVPQQANIPVCVAVGEHYKNPRYAEQLLATGGANGFSPVAFRNPKGDDWSVLDSVSCVSTTFCMVVGTAGTTRKTAHGLRYIGHATAFRWNGNHLRRLTVPQPGHARSPDLAAVSCPTATRCMAAGDYLNAKGRTEPYFARWNHGKWVNQHAPAIGGKASTVLQDVSCPTAAECVAVGDAVKPGTTALAERWTGGKWKLLKTAPERRSAFLGVSCSTLTSCVAVGEHRSKPLIEAWNGTKWKAQAVPTTKAPFTTEVLLHVSCVTPTACTAVGYRHNPKTKFSNRTLALGWNGSKWAVQKTYYN